MNNEIIGASLSEPHTSVTALCMRVCIYVITPRVHAREGVKESVSR